jgi:hypothetical protein
VTRTGIQLIVAHALDDDLVEMNARDFQPRHWRSDCDTSGRRGYARARSLTGRVDRRVSLLLRPLPSRHVGA